MANRGRNPLVLLGPDGKPLTGAQVSIFDATTGVAEPLYTARTGGTTNSQPAAVNIHGRIDGWHDNGAYRADITSSDPAVTPYSEWFEVVSGRDAAIDPPLLAPHAASHRLGGIDPVNFAIFTAQKAMEVGQGGQIRAGRVLTVADFTNMGLQAPAGLWNLSTLNDSSGNARTLINKAGLVQFTPGIMGLSVEAAMFVGSTSQTLYVVDSGAGDALRLKTGSWGCWFRLGRRGVQHILVSKSTNIGGGIGWFIYVNTTYNVLQAQLSLDGTVSSSFLGSVDVVDDKWHFGVVTYDGTRMRLYTDGNPDGSMPLNGPMFGPNAPFNIGSYAGDATTTAISPTYGKIDEVFVTPDVLSEEQIKCLYCARITHSVGSVPSRASLSVRRPKRGRPFLSGDFPQQPLRLHNLQNGNAGDLGTQNTALSGGGTTSAGPDGSQNGAWCSLAGWAGLFSTDAGLPSGTATRSYGLWMKSGVTPSACLIGWGTTSTGDARLYTTNAGLIVAASVGDSITGPNVVDGLWHFYVVVEDNNAFDQARRKLYLDGKVVGSSTVLNSIVLSGAGGFRIGANPGGTGPLTGQVSRAFVTGIALTAEQIADLYNVTNLTLPPSIKAETDHVETLEATSILAQLSTLEGCHLVDLVLAA